MNDEKKAKAKEHKIMHGVYKAGKDFHCGECSAKLEIGDDCPSCQKKFDWAQIEAYRRW